MSSLTVPPSPANNQSLILQKVHVATRSKPKGPYPPERLCLFTFSNGSSVAQVSASLNLFQIRDLRERILDHKIVELTERTFKPLRVGKTEISLPLPISGFAASDYTGEANSVVELDFSKDKFYEDLEKHTRIYGESDSDPLEEFLDLIAEEARLVLKELPPPVNRMEEDGSSLSSTYSYVRPSSNKGSRSDSTSGPSSNSASSVGLSAALDRNEPRLEKISICNNLKNSSPPSQYCVLTFTIPNKEPVKISVDLSVIAIYQLLNQLQSSSSSVITETYEPFSTVMEPVDLKFSRREMKQYLKHNPIYEIPTAEEVLRPLVDQARKKLFPEQETESKMAQSSPSSSYLSSFSVDLASSSTSNEPKLEKIFIDSTKIRDEFFSSISCSFWFSRNDGTFNITTKFVPVADVYNLVQAIESDPKLKSIQVRNFTLGFMSGANDGGPFEGAKAFARSMGEYLQDGMYGPAYKGIEANQMMSKLLNEARNATFKKLPHGSNPTQNQD